MKNKIVKYFDETRVKELLDKLYPICRSIMGPGYRESLDILKKYIPLKDEFFKTGQKVYDWTIPQEWSIDDAYIISPDGKKVLDFRNHNLHILNYSTPINKYVNYKELEKHIYTIRNLPNAIPYVHSYYEKKWGFCIQYNKFKKFSKKGKYKVFINSKHYNGKLITSHSLLKGKSTREIMFSSYLCHPQMANHELSGPIMMTLLYDYIKSLKSRNYTYRFLICPENIGSISYLAKHGKELIKNLDGGMILNCLANGNSFTYKKTRNANSIIDQTVSNVLGDRNLKFKEVDFFPDGSDERQFSSPGFNLQFGLLMRSMFGEFKEYHTSLDNKKFFNIKTFRETFMVYKEIIDTFEMNFVPKAKVQFGTPQLSKLKDSIYPSTMDFNITAKSEQTRVLLEILNLAEGKLSLLEIANLKKFSLLNNKILIDQMLKLNLITKV